MIIIRDESDIWAAIQRIIELDNDDEKYMNTLMQPALQPRMERIFNSYESNLESFLCNIFDQPVEDARRRNMRYANYVEKEVVEPQQTGMIHGLLKVIKDHI